MNFSPSCDHSCHSCNCYYSLLDNNPVNQYVKTSNSMWVETLFACHTSKHINTKCTVITMLQLSCKPKICNSDGSISEAAIHGVMCSKTMQNIPLIILCYSCCNWVAIFFSYISWKLHTFEKHAFAILCYVQYRCVYACVCVFKYIIWNPNIFVSFMIVLDCVFVFKVMQKYCNRSWG